MDTSAGQECRASGRQVCASVSWAPQGRSLCSGAVHFSASRMDLGTSGMGFEAATIHPRGKGVIGEPPQSGGVVGAFIDRREVPGEGECVAT